MRACTEHASSVKMYRAKSMSCIAVSLTTPTSPILSGHLNAAPIQLPGLRRPGGRVRPLLATPARSTQRGCARRGGAADLCDRGHTVSRTDARLTPTFEGRVTFRARPTRISMTAEPDRSFRTAHAREPPGAFQPLSSAPCRPAVCSAPARSGRQSPRR